MFKQRLRLKIDQLVAHVYNPRHQERTRTLFEIGAAVGVTFETHYMSLAVLLMLWAVMDALYLIIGWGRK